jgi:hypothetical protein
MINPWKQISLLQTMPNLRYLTVNTFDNLINGYQWEQIIRNYLPKLKIFVLSMRQQLPDLENIQEQVDELINSFRTSFWIDEHRWFVRCFTYNKTIRLETSSRMFGDLKLNFPDSWRSTYPHDSQEKFYSNMIGTYDDQLFSPPLPFDMHFDNIHDLRLKFPITEKLLSMFPNLSKLGSLSIFSRTVTYQSQLQTLLSRAPHLRNLYIYHDKSSPLQMSLFDYANTLICQLNIYYYWFNEKECITLIHSQLGLQCQELSIHVKNRECIIILAKNMINLGFLHIESKDDEFGKRLLLIEDNNELYEIMKSNKDELVEWLKERLPSTYAISRDPFFINHIRIWI